MAQRGGVLAARQDHHVTASSQRFDFVISPDAKVLRHGNSLESKTRGLQPELNRPERCIRGTTARMDVQINKERRRGRSHLTPAEDRRSFLRERPGTFFRIFRLAQDRLDGLFETEPVMEVHVLASNSEFLDCTHGKRRIGS